MPESRPYGAEQPLLGSLLHGSESQVATPPRWMSRQTREPNVPQRAITLFPRLESLQITRLSIFGGPSPAPPPTQASYIEIIPKVNGRWLGPGAPRQHLHLPPSEGTARSQQSAIWKRAFTSTCPCRLPDLRLTSSRTVKINVCCVQASQSQWYVVIAVRTD